MGKMPGRPAILLAVFALFSSIAAGCGPEERNTADRTPTVVHIRTFFPQDMDGVNRIDMQKAGGERKTIYDKETVDAWIGRVGDLEVTVDADPEETTGVLFQIGLYADGEPKLSLASRTVNGTVIAGHEELVELMWQLWNGGDGRRPSRWGELPSASDHAELVLDGAFFKAHAGSITTLRLKNAGPAMLHVGGEYWVEQYDQPEGGWQELPLALADSSERHSVGPGETFSQPFAVPAQLKAGQYRVVKEVRTMAETGAGTERSDPVYLACVFQIWRAD